MDRGPRVLLALALPLALGTTSPAVLGQCELAKLQSPHSVAGSYYGLAVDLAPGLAAISQPSFEGAGTWPTGVVHLYEPAGEAWALAQSLTPAGGAPEDGFGYSVATDGERLVVGAFGDDEAGADAGAVYVYERFPGGPWVQQAKLLPPAPAVGMRLGTRVAFSGERIVASALFAEVAGPLSGTAFVYERHGGAWAITAQLAPPAHFAGDHFGVAVDIDGETAVVGAYGEGDLDVGALHVFETDGSTWSHVARLEGSDTTAWSNYGFSLALEQERLVVGAPASFVEPSGTLPRGAVYVYERSGGTWNETAKLVGDPAFPHGGFGTAVDLAGERIAVGAPMDSDSLGATYVFERRAGTWVEIARLSASDGIHWQLFGRPVAISRETVLASTSSWQGASSSAYLFDAFGCGPGLPFCFGDGCPCGNDDLLGGCASSTGAGARLSTEGSASLAAGDLALFASELPAGELVFFVQGEGLVGGGAGAPFFDGLLCAGGALVRLEIAVADGAGQARTAGDLGGARGVLAGESRSYQAWYRDPSGPCGSGANLSNAYQLRWRP